MAGATEQEQAALAEVQDAKATRTHPAEGTYCATAIVTCSSRSPGHGSHEPATYTSDTTCSSNGSTVRSNESCSTVSSSSGGASAAGVPTAAAEGPTALQTYLVPPVSEQVITGSSEQQQGTAADVQDAQAVSCHPAADSSCATALVSCKSSSASHGSPRPATQDRDSTCSSRISILRDESTCTHPAPNSSRGTAPVSFSSSSPDPGSPRPATQTGDATCCNNISFLRGETPSIHPAADDNTNTAAASCSSGGAGRASLELATRTSDVTCSSINTPRGDNTSTHPAVDSRGDTVPASCSSSSPSHCGPRPPTRSSSNNRTASSSTSSSTVTSISSSAPAAAISTAAAATLPSHLGRPMLEQVIASIFVQQTGTTAEAQDAEEIGTHSAAGSRCATAPALYNSNTPGDGSPVPATQINDLTCSSSINTPKGDTTSTHPAADSSRDTAPASCSSSTPEHGSPEPATQISAVICNSNGSTARGGPSCSTISNSITSSSTAEASAMVVAGPPALHSYPNVGPKQYEFHGDTVSSTCGDTGHVAEECCTHYCSLCCCHGHPTGCCSTACSTCGKIHAEPRGTSCSACKCAFCHLWGHVAATCPSARCNRCGCYGHISKERCRALAAASSRSRYDLAAAAAAPTNISPRDLTAAAAAAAGGSSSSRSDLAAAAQAAFSIDPKDLSPSQIRLQRPTNLSEARTWLRRLLRTLRVAVPAYAAAVGSQPHKLACLSCVAPNDLAAIMQLQHPTEFLDRVYQNYCDTTCGSSSRSSSRTVVVDQQQGAASTTAGSEPLPAQQPRVTPPSIYQAAAVAARISLSGLTAAASSSSAPDLAAPAPAAVSINPQDLSPSQIMLQQPNTASEANRWKQQLLNTLQAAVPAYAVAVGSQPHKLACLSHVVPNDLAAIMQLQHPTEFLDRVYQHYCGTTCGSSSSSSSSTVVVDQQQGAASTAAGSGPLPAQQPRVTPSSIYQAAAAPVSISLSGLTAAASSSSAPDLAAAAQAAISIDPKDLSPSQIRLQRPTNLSEARTWLRRLLRTLRVAVPAYAAAGGSQPHKLACLSCVAPDDLAAIMQLQHPTEFLDRVYQHYCAMTCGSSSRSSSSTLVVDQQQGAASTTAGSEPLPAQQLRVTPPSVYHAAAAPVSISPSGSVPDLAAPAAAAVSIDPKDLSPSQIRLQRPTNLSEARTWLQRLLRTLRGAIPAYAAAVGSQPHILACLSCVAPDDLAAIMQLDHPFAFLHRVYQHYCDTTYGSSNTVQQEAASTTGCPAPLAAQPLWVTPTSRCRSATDKVNLVPPLAQVPVTTGSYYTPSPVLMHPAAPLNYQPAADQATALPSVAHLPVGMGSWYAPSTKPMLPAAPSHYQPAAARVTALPHQPAAVPVLARSSSYCTPVSVPMLPAAPARVPMYQMVYPAAIRGTPSTHHKALAPQLAPQIVPHFAPQLAPQLAPQFAAPIVSQPSLPWPQQTMPPAAAATTVWAPPAAAWQQQQSRQSLTMGISRTSSSSSMGSGLQQTSMQPAAAGSHELLTSVVISSGSSSMPSRLRGRSAGLYSQVQCMFCGYCGHVADDCKACSICKQHGHTTEDCTISPAAAGGGDVTTATAAVASVIASWQLPRPAAAAVPSPPPEAAAAVPLPFLSPALPRLPQTAAAAMAAAPSVTAAEAAEEVTDTPVVAAAEAAVAESAAEAAAAAAPPPLQAASGNKRNRLKNVYACTECWQPRHEGYDGQLVKPARSSCNDASMQPVRVTAGAGDAQIATAAAEAAAIALLRLPPPAAAARCLPPAAATSAFPLLPSSPALAPPPQAAATTAASSTGSAAEPPPPPPPVALAAAATATAAPTTLAAPPPPLPVTTAAADVLSPPSAPAQCAVPSAAFTLENKFQLKAEPANPEALKDMIAVLVQRLFIAAQSAYALDLLQQQQQGKLHCLARLSAADLDSILEQNDSLELLDAIYGKHSQHQRDLQQQEYQPLLSEQESDRAHVQQQQLQPTSDPWQQPLMESPQEHAVQQGDVTTVSHSTVFPHKKQRQKLGVFDSWQPPQEQPLRQTNLSQQQDSIVQQQGQLPALGLASASCDRPESVMVDDSLYFDSSSDSDLDLLFTIPTVAAPAHLQHATGQVELASEVDLVGQYTTPEQEGVVQLARSHTNRGGVVLEVSHEADVYSDDSDIADMLTMLMCH